MNREVRKNKNAAKEEWIDELRKNVEKEVMLENSKEAYNTIKALPKTQQHR